MVSINASGHKFGLVYPGVGWCIFRSKAFLPDSLVFHDNYLGTDQISFTLNFSKGASQMRTQSAVLLAETLARNAKVSVHCTTKKTCSPCRTMVSLQLHMQEDPGAAAPM